MPKARRPNTWTADERFRAILETANLNEEELGAYCRSIATRPRSAVATIEPGLS